MMPKGVEHEKLPLNAVMRKPVRIPMMPKGVEHSEHEESIIVQIRENSNDAERR